ncbi:MAG: HD domain-containing phosphohydrolase [Solirubrobacteraceae bacterium]
MPIETGLTVSGGESPRLADRPRAKLPRSSHRLALRGFVLLAAVGIAVHGLHAAGAFGGVPHRLVDDWLYCGLYALAAAACLRHAIVGDARLAWTAATLGVIVWGAAEVVFRLVEPSSRASYPPVSQAMLLVGFSLAYTTLILLARARVRRFDPLLALDGMIAGAGGASVAAALIFQPLAAAPSVTGSDVPAPSVYLAGAVLGMAFVLTVVGLTGWRPGRVWSLIVTAITVNTIGDVVLVREVAAGGFHRGSIADTLFVASALLLGLAAFYPGRPAPVAPRRARYLPIPIAVAVVAIAVLIVASFSDLGALAVSLAAIALLLTLIRMAVALRLLERSRREALTDGLTGLGNRQKLYRDLGRLLAAGPAARPSTLALLDLNGFKRYNDSFGHLSGDAILARLADRLATAVAPAQAYRMGGDEFCLLVEATGRAAQAIVGIAHGALEEHGDGFSVTNCYGVVTLPDDAHDVHGALATADARMYAQKAGERPPEQRVAPDAVLQVLGEHGPPLRSRGRDVAELAGGVARRLGLDPAGVDEVARAADLHDIGKMAVPDDIVYKRGPLDDMERSFMRQHVTVGERMLRAAPSLARLAPLVRSSHERWDGSGYPDGLAGGGIPLGARIIAACDAYHAMRSRRPHSQAVTREEALRELRRCAGSQFDPQVVRAIEAEVEARAAGGEATGRRNGVFERERRDSNLRPPA